MLCNNTYSTRVWVGKNPQNHISHKVSAIYLTVSIMKKYIISSKLVGAKTWLFLGISTDGNEIMGFFKLSIPQILIYWWLVY